MKRILPPSVTNGWVVGAGLLTLLLSLYLTVSYFKIEDKMLAATICLAATALVQIVLDIFVLKVYLRPNVGFQWSQNTPSMTRTITKFFGLLGSMAFIGFLYWLFPEYHGSFYSHYWNVLILILPWWVGLAIPYFHFVDGKQKDTHDSYLNFGYLVTMRLKLVNRAMLVQHLLAWLVKGFFFPLMFTYFVNDLTRFSEMNFSSLVSFKTIFDFTYDLIFLIDVAVVSIGYVMSLKITDSHMRSTEPTMLGWAIALICYEPFWSLIGKQYLDYNGKLSWGSWLSDSPLLYNFWGTVILVLFSIYAWSSIMFGLRFSNLTHRGILTNGPYRFTKHPAYVTKNIAWWLVAVPFVVDGSFADTLKRCSLLALLNLIYFVRAKTEERHLGQDPLYQQYALWISENGIFRKLFSFRKST